MCLKYEGGLTEARDASLCHTQPWLAASEFKGRAEVKRAGLEERGGEEEEE